MTQSDPDQDPGLEPDPLRRTTRRTRSVIIIAAAAAVTLLSALLSGLAVVFLGGESDSGQSAVPLPLASTTAASTTPTRPPTTATPTPKPTTPEPTTSVPTASPTPTTSVLPRPFAYQPLWPFVSTAEAAAWQRRYRAGGQQPWHLDAELTALSFTTGFLGFSEINKVASSSIRGDDARIAVGYQAVEGAVSVAAVLHLVRIGQGQDAPWEVVGSADTTLTLDRPQYGATAVSPLTVSGRITGVDETIRVEIRQPSSGRPIGTSCCIATGGDQQPWSTRVTFQGATDPALTIVASTGGHLQSVERFAITGVRSTN
ncbi:hypothetical protein ACFPJ1_02165 [Kribbella qitaiheensis]|uniref:hypothetical protein n=1 Tax=Kribbella qitaiheensis TaxID=1544730 RepID=UPI00360B1A23